MGSEGHDDWMKFIMGMSREYKDRYGEWVFDIETHDHDDDEEHFSGDDFEI